MLKLSVEDVNTYFWLVWDGQETATCTPRVHKTFTFFMSVMLLIIERQVVRFKEKKGE